MFCIAPIGCAFEVPRPTFDDRSFRGYQLVQQRIVLLKSLVQLLVVRRICDVNGADQIDLQGASAVLPAAALRRVSDDRRLHSQHFAIVVVFQTDPILPQLRIGCIGSSLRLILVRRLTAGFALTAGRAGAFVWARAPAPKS